MPGEDNHSYLHSIRVENIGCIGSEGLEVQLDEIVCFVGANNSGKSTVLRAYELAVGAAGITEKDFCTRRNGAPARVELSVHIPKDTPNVAEKWKIPTDGSLLVRSRWTWTKAGPSTRETWDPETEDWAEDGKAGGVDEVFNSRLPQPFRIEALDGPVDEHSKLLKLILEPIAAELESLLQQEGTDVSLKREQFLAAARAPVEVFKEKIERAQKQVSKSYGKVFSSAELVLKVDVAPPAIDAMQSLLKGSSLKIKEHNSECDVDQQGTGSQRALFWSMLEVRSALKKELDAVKAKAKEKAEIQKKLQKIEDNPGKLAKTIEDNKQKSEQLKARLQELDGPDQHSVSLPGYMLLIDEPEIALHPNAVRAAKGHLYGLAQDSGWQVMLSTHCPAFVDPTQDHTTIVRLARTEANPTPQIFRSDEAELSDDERSRLQMLLQFNPSVAELFFGSYPILVEGDTEYAAFLQVVQSNPEAFPEANRPAVIRAVGKALLVPLIKVLRHFKIPFSVLHDADSPKRSNGTGNGMWTENGKIFDAVEACRAAGVHVVHRISIPDFERRFNLGEGKRDKPFMMWELLKGNEDQRRICNELMSELLSPQAVQSQYPAASFKDDLVAAVRNWAQANAQGDSRYQF